MATILPCHPEAAVLHNFAELLHVITGHTSQKGKARKAAGAKLVGAGIHLKIMRSGARMVEFKGERG